MMCFNTVTLASSQSTLPGDGDHTETYWSSFNVHLHTLIFRRIIPVVFYANYEGVGT